MLGSVLSFNPKSPITSKCLKSSAGCFQLPLCGGWKWSSTRETELPDLLGVEWFRLMWLWWNKISMWVEMEMMSDSELNCFGFHHLVVLLNKDFSNLFRSDPCAEDASASWDFISSWLVYEDTVWWDFLHIGYFAWTSGHNEIPTFILYRVKCRSLFVESQMMSNSRRFVE